MHVKMLAAITIDGKIAKNASEFIDWTGKEDKKYFMQQTLNTDAVIMGSTTFKTLNAPLKNRRLFIMTSNKNYEYDDKNIVFVNDSPKNLLIKLQNIGINNVIIAGGSHVYSSFLKYDLIDEIHLTIVSKIFGDGISLCHNIEKDCRLKATRTLNDGNIILIYDVIKTK